MKIARICACSLITGGLIFTGMTVHANPSSSGTQSGAMEGSGSKGGTGESMNKDGSMKQDKNKKMGKDSSRQKEKDGQMSQPQRSEKAESPRCFGPPPTDASKAESVKGEEVPR